ncbi:uncharacterized protein LOC129585354 [Paramacrobiotus metropolitanus]|uniref:uncharacterized protein LOC129585354 n=1 Tax=Paramacrobiotus metropolitanus TaxID=2943436 RepID=UPI002445A0FB|nr:uncharacterized protein LOC129585354 [Paramacrobiotus metropolitanus]
MLGMKTAQQIISERLRDMNSFITAKLASKIAISDVLRDAGDVKHFVFVDRQAEFCLSPSLAESSRSMILNDINLILDLIPTRTRSLQQPIIVENHGRVCAYSQFDAIKTSQPAPASTKTAHRYELFTWHDPSTSGNRIRNLQQRLIDRLTQLTTTTSARPRKQQSLITRLLY